MTSNDSSTTANKRYSVWPSADLAEENGPEYATWQEAHEDQSKGNDKWRVWDHTLTDVTENNPEGTHMATPHPGKRTPALTIPEAVTKVLIQRHAYKTGHLTVVIAGKGWGMDFTCTDAEVLTRIHEIAAAMEAVK